MCSTRQRLASLLREARQTRKLSLRQAAALAEIAPSTLSRWESGSCVPRVPELENLLNALGIPAQDQTRILASLNVPRAAKSVRDEPTPPSGGELLKALRRRAGLSLVEVALGLGVATSTVSRWESCAALPPPSMLRTLLDRLKATPEERACIEVSGVAKLKADRPMFVYGEYVREIDQVEILMEHGQNSTIELRLLQLQSELWWAQEEDARELLRRVRVTYARFLERHGRYVEATAQAQRSLEEAADTSDALAAEAQRVIARADVYRWPTKRPHLGLYTLQQALKNVRDEKSRSALLADMAQYSQLAGRMEEAAMYAKRATHVNVS